MENTYSDSRDKKQSKEIDFQWFIINFLVSWKWFLFSAILSLLIGHIYLRYATPTYHIGAKIVMKDSKRGGMSNSELAVFEGMGVLNNTNSIVENEVQVLQARNLIETVVKEKNLFINYYVKGRFKNTELYGNANSKYYGSVPVKVYADSTVLSGLRNALFMTISFTDRSTYTIAGNYGATELSAEYQTLPAVLETPIGELLLTADPHSVLRKEYPLNVLIIPTLWAAQGYMGLLSVELGDKSTTVIPLALRETHRQRGEDFLSKLIEVYNRDAMSEKNKAAENASQFLNERSDELRSSLAVSEKEIEEYKQKNHIPDLKISTSLYINEDNEFDKQLVQLNTDMVMLAYVNDEIKKGYDSEVLLPASIGLTNSSLSSSMTEYNLIMQRRKSALNSTSEGTPTINDMDAKIKLLKESITNEIKSAQYNLRTKKKETEQLNNRFKSDIQNIPRLERELAIMLREQQSKSNLLVELLRRKESIDLTLKVTVPSAKILESPLAGGQISPRKNTIYLYCLIFGLLCPFVILGLRGLFNYKVEDEGETRRVVTAPVIISIPVSKNSDSMVVKPHATNSIVERFRLLRTNLQFILDDPNKKTILVTSSISGEGKTFVAINLAMTFALKYKTLLVGLDIRRPKINTYLGLPKTAGLISYLTGEETNIETLIHKNIKNTSLDVLASGVIPPNPNELLMEQTLDAMFQDLRKIYDYIIVDTSPAGSVSDAFLLNRVADASLYIVRRNITPKSAITLLNSIYNEKRLQNINVVLNAFGSGRAGRYGYSYGNYGYGYGYGYEYGYSSE
ncbi:MAG: polysaccharide biosynthesis tyrosine autokinase [Mediterranea sp.]|jgi:capsular exopolysaccharide synthesis family protein|nr:polysaccharide biosynthesis tyrosine autokinase [Mediterranea sp.]